MKHIENYNSYNESIKNKKDFLFSIFDKDNKKIQSYINIFNNQDYNFFIKIIFGNSSTKYVLTQYTQTLEIIYYGSGTDSTIYYGSERLKISKKLQDDLFKSMRRISENNNLLFSVIYYYIFTNTFNDFDDSLPVIDRYRLGRYDTNKKEELLDRIDEFGVIKDYKLDIISINNLFDFYDRPFNESQFLSQIKINI